jgi:hypothetical protein
MPPVNDTTGAMNEAEVTFDNSNVYENVSQDMSFDNLDADDEEGIVSEEDEEHQDRR